MKWRSDPSTPAPRPVEASSETDVDRASDRDGLFGRWARLAVRRRWWVVASWIVVLAALVILNATIGEPATNRFLLPNAESQQALDLLQQRFPAQAGDTAQIVVQTESSLDDASSRARLETLLTDAAGLPGVIAVSSPLETPGAISPDRTIAYATVQYADQAYAVPPADVDALIALVDSASADGFTAEVGGQIIAQVEEQPPGESSAIAAGAALVVLVIAFGSVVAAGLPILTALIGLAGGFMGIGIAARFLDVANFTPAIAAMIGLGVGIDYALFILTRYREGLSIGLCVPDAIAKAMDTSGRSVALAAVIVIIAVLGLTTVGVPIATAFAVASAQMVLLAALLALTLLPALLGFAGRRVDRWRIPGIRTVTTSDRSFGYRLSTRIGRRPRAVLPAAAALLILLAIPILDVSLGIPDAGSKPTSFHTRRAYDLLSEGFGPGFNGPLMIAIERGGGVDEATLTRLADSVEQTPGVATVNPPTINPEGDTAVMTVIATTSPQDEQTTRLVAHLREQVIPSALRTDGTVAYVGGPTAAFSDLSERLGSRTPVFIAIVVGLSILLLTVIFRSPVIALTAAAMNLLSIGATYGVLVAVFQWGWGLSLIGVDVAGPVASFMPMFLFAILFGLSMDYEIFLLSRIRESWLSTGDTREAIATGLGNTARVITAAATIMVLVFLSFVLIDDPITKQFGLGLAVAILLDATIVRLILVPATMTILGRWNWWLPAHLGRRLPRIAVEGAARTIS